MKIGDTQMHDFKGGRNVKMQGDEVLTAITVARKKQLHQ